MSDGARVLAALDAGDGVAAIAEIAALPPRGRRALASAIFARYARWNAGEWVTDSRGRMSHEHAEGDDRQRAAVHRAAVAVATAAELCGPWGKCPSIDMDSDTTVEICLAVGAPPWLNADGIETLAAKQNIDWRTLEALVAAGLCERPRSDALVERLVEGTGFRSDVSLVELLRGYRGLVEGGLLYRLFEVEGGQQSSLAAADKYRGERNQWATALAALCASGELDRARVLDATLEALTRDFATFRAGWFSRFHDKLAPSDSERAERAERYLVLLGSTIPATASFALKCVEKLAKQQRYDADTLMAALPPALIARQKGVVKRAAKLLVRTAKTPEHAAEAVALAIDALAHPDRDVHESLLDAVDKLAPLAHHTPRATALRGQLLAARELVAPSLRPRVATTAALLAPPDDAEAHAAPAAGTHGAVASEPAPLELAAAEPAPVTLATDLEDALDRVAYALEHEHDAIAQEVALDAIARHAGPSTGGTHAKQARGPHAEPLTPERWSELCGPLRKRARALSRSMTRSARPLQLTLAQLSLAWVERAQQPALPDPGPRVLDLALYQHRADAIAARVVAGVSLPLLSTPTHEGGRVSLQRLRAVRAAYKKARAPLDPYDAVSALMRVAPAERKRARRTLAALGPPAAAALDEIVAGVHRVARDFHVNVRESSGGYTFYDVEANARDEPPAPRSALEVARWYCRGPIYGDVACTRWCASLAPHELEPHFACGVERVSFHGDDPLITAVHLTPARDPWVVLGPTGHWLLMLALSARGARAAELGVDVAIDGLARGRVSAAMLGDVLAQLLPSGMLKAKRLAATLAQIAEVSPEHDTAVRTVISRGLRGDPAAAPRDVASLLALFYELSVAADAGLVDVDALAWLEAQSRGGQVAKMRRALLAIAPSAAR